MVAGRTVFDLRELRSSAPIRARQIGRWVGAAMATVFLVVIAYAILAFYTVHRGFSGWSAGTSAALLIPGIGLAAGLYVVGQTGPGDDRAEVDEDGLTLVFASGSAWRTRWNDPNCSLHFEQTHGITRRGGGGVPMIFLARRFPAQFYLTEEAYQAIVEKAIQKGLRVSTGPSDWVEGWTRTTVKPA